MEERGIVQSTADGEATVRLVATASCDGCSQGSLCHPGDGADRILKARDPLGVRKGQSVTVHVPGQGVWMALGLVYGWPLLMMAVGAVLGHRLGGGAGAGNTAELASAGLALLFLCVAFLALRAFRTFYEQRASFRPVIVSVHDDPMPQTASGFSDSSKKIR